MTCQTRHRVDKNQRLEMVFGLFLFEFEFTFVFKMSILSFIFKEGSVLNLQKIQKFFRNFCL